MCTGEVGLLVPGPVTVHAHLVIVIGHTQEIGISVVVDMLRSLEYGVYVLLGLFIFTVFAIVHMIIRNFIYFLQDEVEIIELVGGNASFVYGPFVVQGMFYTGIATIVALTLLWTSRSVFLIDFVS